MMRTIHNADQLGINMEINAFTVTNSQLFTAISEAIATDTITDHELRETFFIVRKQLQNLNWLELVADSVRHLPLGLTQTCIAWDGAYPCTGCPDAMMSDSRCQHQEECKAWEIYEARY